MENVLEQWLHDKIRQEWRQNEGYRRFAGKQVLEQITRADVNSFHIFKLRETLAYSYRNSSFYKELFDRNGIASEKIRNADDWAKIPFTTPEDLRESPHRLLCVSFGDVGRTISFTSSGTTGRPKKISYTAKDIDKMTEFMEMGMRTVATDRDVVQILLPGGSPSGQLDLLSRAVARLGALPIKAGTGLAPNEQLSLIKKHHTTVLFGQTGRIYRMTQELLAKDHDLSKLGVKTLFLTSVYLPDPMRQRLMSIWNCEVSFHYGMSELGLGVAVECQDHNGFHFNEADLFLEIIDPVTGEVIEDEGEGELVFSTLGREGVPLIRYRTHDISRWITSPCSCGATTLVKFAKTTKRLESIVTVGEDDEIYPAMFDDLLYTVSQVYDYELTVEQKEGIDYLHFTIEVIEQDFRVQEGINRAITNCAVIRKNLNIGAMLPPKIELVPVGSLDHTRRAKKLILDRRSS